MSVVRRRVRVTVEAGLHARPASSFVHAAGRASGQVTIAKPGEAAVSAKSILTILSLNVQCGDEIVITAEGTDAERVLDRLTAVVAAAEQD